MRKSNLRVLIFPAAALALEMLPCGAVLNFARPIEEGGTIRQTFSYFDLTPFGYANFGPFITALFTCAATAAALIFLFSDSMPWLKAVQYISLAAFAVSLTPMLYGISMYSVAGGLISLMLAASWGLCMYESKTRKNNK